MMSGVNDESSQSSSERPRRDDEVEDLPNDEIGLVFPLLPHEVLTPSSDESDLDSYCVVCMPSASSSPDMMAQSSLENADSWIELPMPYLGEVSGSESSSSSGKVTTRSSSATSSSSDTSTSATPLTRHRASTGTPDHMSQGMILPPLIPVGEPGSFIANNLASLKRLEENYEISIAVKDFASLPELKVKFTSDKKQDGRQASPNVATVDAKNEQEDDTGMSDTDVEDNCSDCGVPLGPVNDKANATELSFSPRHAPVPDDEIEPFPAYDDDYALILLEEDRVHERWMRRARERVNRYHAAQRRMHSMTSRGQGLDQENK